MIFRLILSFLMLCGWAFPTVALDRQDYLIGWNLTPAEAESLEERLEADPGDTRARTHLIIYYGGQRFVDEGARRARRNHVLWLIRNAPEAEVLSGPEGSIDPHRDADGYVAGKDAWLNHIERAPTKVTFLSHAATFLSRHQDRDLAHEYLRKLLSLDPDNPHRPYDLGFFYWLEATGARPDIKKTKAVQALEQFERAWASSSDESRPRHWLTSLGKAAMAAERHDDARTYATAMLDNADHDDYGDFTHHGNLVLGMLALIENDIEKTRHHLLQAGRTRGSPVLGSFGPSMDLALQLLRQGEREVVLEYFELCSRFWPRDRLNDWAAMVRGGGIPDFGGNLDY